MLNMYFWNYKGALFAFWPIHSQLQNTLHCIVWDSSNFINPGILIKFCPISVPEKLCVQEWIHIDWCQIWHMTASFEYHSLPTAERSSPLYAMSENKIWYFFGGKYGFFCTLGILSERMFSSYKPYKIFKNL